LQKLGPTSYLLLEIDIWPKLNIRITTAQVAPQGSSLRVVLFAKEMPFHLLLHYLGQLGFIFWAKVDLPTLFKHGRCLVSTRVTLPVHLGRWDSPFVITGAVVAPGQGTFSESVQVSQEESHFCGSPGESWNSPEENLVESAIILLPSTPLLSFPCLSHLVPPQSHDLAKLTIDILPFR